MRRYIRSSRSRENVHSTSALRDQFLRQLTREAEALLKELNEQFAQTLNTQLAQFTQNIVGGDTGQPNTSLSNEPGTIGSIGQMLATGVRYLVSRPRTSRNTAETSRSIDANASFRVSQSQAAIEMQAVLARGEKNA